MAAAKRMGWGALLNTVKEKKHALEDGEAPAAKKQKKVCTLKLSDMRINI